MIGRESHMEETPAYKSSKITAWEAQHALKTYFLFFELEESDAIGEKFNIISGPFLRGTLLGELVAHLHKLAGRHRLVAILRIILLLEAIDIRWHVSVELVCARHLVRASLTMRSRAVMLLHLLNNKN